MKIQLIAPVKPAKDWRIIIKEFSTNCFEILLELLKDLGFERDFDAEKKNERFGSSYIYVKEDNSFNFLYKCEVLAGGWQSAEYDGPTFIQLLKSKMGTEDVEKVEFELTEARPWNGARK